MIDGPISKESITIAEGVLEDCIFVNFVCIPFHTAVSLRVWIHGDYTGEVSMVCCCVVEMCWIPFSIVSGNLCVESIEAGTM